MDPKTRELVDVLTEIVRLMDENQQQDWARWMTTAKRWILASDFSGIEKVLKAYGGMGSFNDLVLGYPSDADGIKPRPDYQALNLRLDSLRERAWELARAIKREVESSR